METFDPLILTRLQFAVTALFHILWPVLTIGLSCFILLAEALWFKTRVAAYYHHARFWSKLLLLNFGVGVVTGLPLEFEFGTNWSGFAVASGDLVGPVLGFEAAMAFMLEAGFLGIMMFGWRRVAPLLHLFATAMVALGAVLSGFWIMAANAWIHTPAGGTFAAGRFFIEDFSTAIFNPFWFWSVTHMMTAALETTLFVIGGISAWHLLKNRHREFFLRSFKLAVTVIIVIAPLQIYLGDGSGRTVFEHQPAKGAAIEGHWQTNPPGEGADWALAAWPDKDHQDNAWEIKIPDLLSLLATHSLTGEVTGLHEFAPADQPPLLPLLFYSFRLMIAIGFYFLIIALWSGWVYWRHGCTLSTLYARPWLLRAWVAAAPLGFIAVEAGWIVREVGRQPWVIYGVLRTADATSGVPAGTVAISLTLYSLLYAALLFFFLFYARRVLGQGPDLEERPPGQQSSAVYAGGVQ